MSKKRVTQQARPTKPERMTEPPEQDDQATKSPALLALALVGFPLALLVLLSIIKRVFDL